MYIDPNWRVLTVGDGDLSFSYSLLEKYPTLDLTATVYDDKTSFVAKYPENYYDELKSQTKNICFEFDVTDSSTWRNTKPIFDVVIFQFPLVPNSASKAQFQVQSGHGSANTLNRALLYKFISNAFNSLLSEEGARLVYISSKEVKPYIEWNIEKLMESTDFAYMGKHRFEPDSFPNYKMRNVDRNKFVKHTQLYTHIWSDKALAIQEFSLLQPFVDKTEGGCGYCRAGPFTTLEEKLNHEGTQKHQRILNYEKQWKKYKNTFL